MNDSKNNNLTNDRESISSDYIRTLFKINIKDKDKNLETKSDNIGHN